MPKIKFCIELLYLKHEGMTHLRRIKTEERAKVVAAASGAELINFFAMLAILHQDDMKNRMNSSPSSNHSDAKKLVWQ